MNKNRLLACSLLTASLLLTGCSEEENETQEDKHNEILKNNRDGEIQNLVMDKENNAFSFTWEFDRVLCEEYSCGMHAGITGRFAQNDGSSYHPLLNFQFPQGKAVSKLDVACDYTPLNDEDLYEVSCTANDEHHITEKNIYKHRSANFLELSFYEKGVNSDGEKGQRVAYTYILNVNDIEPN